MPKAVFHDQGVGLFRSPSARLVRASRVAGHENWLDNRPGGLNGVLAGEERTVAGHGVTQKPLVGRFLSRLFFNQVEFFLIANELRSGAV